MRFRYFLPLLIAPLMLAGAKKPQVTLRFHLKANPSDPFVIPLQIPGMPTPVNVKKIPEVAEGDVVAIHPFAAADGTYGCALKLNFQGTLRLDTVSTEDKGKVLVTLFNGRLVTAMLIDKRVQDGVIFIPSGLTAPEIEMLKKAYPQLGATKAKK